IPEERALGEEARRPPGRDSKDHRIEKPVRVIENENQGLPRRNPLPSLDDAGGIVEADQRFSQPPKQRRKELPHEKIIRRMEGGLPSRCGERPSPPGIPGGFPVYLRGTASRFGMGHWARSWSFSLNPVS